MVRRSAGLARRGAALLALTLCALACAPVHADDAPAPGPAPSAAAPTPRLAVLVVVDQLRLDFLERFAARMKRNESRGFRRLLLEGASWVDARHRHGGTFTGPGHATISTGTDPSVHGIVGNEWWQRAGVAAKGRRVYCCEDPGAGAFGAPGVEGAAKVGLKNLRAETLGDAMKLAHGGAPRAIGISGKDRSALLLAGRRADAAFWLDAKAGGFVTGTELPAFTGAAGAPVRAALEPRLLAWNAERLPTFMGPWTLDPRAPTGYDEAEEDARPEEGHDAAFPHAPHTRLDFLHLVQSPGGNDALLAFLEAFVPLGPPAQGETRDAAAERLALGAREGVVDLLALSFSATDAIGHRYGAESQEAADAFVRLDDEMARLLDLLDRRVGKGRWWLALSADHGVAPLPEWATRVGLDAGRVRREDVEKALAAGFVGGGAMEDVEDGSIYLSRIAGQDPSLRRLREEGARDALLAVPGVWRVYTRSQLLEGTVPADDPGLAALRSFDPERSGDLVFQLRPGWLFGGQMPGTTHGQPWGYDARVPIVLFGPGVRPGPRLEPAATVDIAPTLAALMHVGPPGASLGRILLEGIDREAWQATDPLR